MEIAMCKIMKTKKIEDFANLFTVNEQVKTDFKTFAEVYKGEIFNLTIHVNGKWIIESPIDGFSCGVGMDVTNSFLEFWEA